MASVAHINVTPVKGTRLSTTSRARIGPEGIEGNREFFFVGSSGSPVSCSDRGVMMQVLTEHDPSTDLLRFEFPDGRIVEGPAGDLGEPFATDMYGRTLEVSPVLGDFDEPMSRHIGQRVRLVRAATGSYGNDVHPITLVSLASVEELARRGGHAGPLDPRRFRMNLELDGCAPFEEDTWSGATLRIGGTVLRVLGQVPRCRATTLGPETGAKDWDTLKEIARFRTLIRPPDKGIPFGMYAHVLEPGEVRVGDRVRVLATST